MIRQARCIWPRRGAVPLLLAALCLGACDGVAEQEEFRNQAFVAPSGITQTDQSGTVLSRDEDDWRVSPIYFERVVIDPAFPNPVPAGATVSIPIRVRLTDSVQGGLDLVSYDINRIPRLLDRVRDARNPGAYVFRFDPAVIGLTGIIRVYIIDSAGGLVSYGDLQVGS